MSARIPLLWPLAAMSLVQAMTTLALTTVPVLAPAIGASHGIDAARIAVYPSVAFIGATAMAVVSASLVRRFGGVRVNQSSLVLATLGLTAAIAGPLPALFAGAILAGAGYGMATPGASHVLARVAPPARRGLVFSIKQSAVPLGGVVAGVMLPRVTEAYDWRTAIGVSIALVVAAALAVQPIRSHLDDDRVPDHPITFAGFGESVMLALREPPLRAMIGVCFAFAAMQLCLFGFLVTFLVDHVELSLVTAGLMFSTMQIAGIGARVLWGWVSDRLVPARPLLALLGAGTIASTLVAASFGPDTPLALIAVVAAAMGASAVGWNGIYLAEVARVVPIEKVGAATGGTLMFTFAGIIIGPAAFGAIVESTGSYAAAFATFDAVIAAFVVVMIVPRRRSG